MAGMVLLERMRTRPNVCIIVIDSLRADALRQVAGSAKTPYIHQLMQDGVQFPRAFSHSPRTLPAHASLFSARLPHEIGIVQNGQTFFGDVELLAGELQGSGYETYGFASLPALDTPSIGFAIERGFDHWSDSKSAFMRASDVNLEISSQLAELASSEPFLLYAHYSDPHEPYNANGSLVHEAEVLWNGELLQTASTSETTFIDRELRVPPGTHMFDMISQFPFRMREFTSDAPDGVTVTPRPSDLDNKDGDISITISNNTDRVLSVSISAWLHDIPTVSEARVRYRSEVEAVDAAIGLLITDLKARGLYDNTLIIVTANHGEALGEHGTLGHGSTLYDEVLHVPLVMKLPKNSELKNILAHRTETLARQIDIAPTILDVLGLNPMRSATGQSLLQDNIRVLVAETQTGTPPQAMYCMRDERYKLIYHANEKRFEMYDLARDPSELDDVFRTQGHLCAGWQQELKTLLRRAL